MMRPPMPFRPMIAGGLLAAALHAAADPPATSPLFRQITVADGAVTRQIGGTWQAQATRPAKVMVQPTDESSARASEAPAPADEPRFHAPCHLLAQMDRSLERMRRRLVEALLHPVAVTIPDDRTLAVDRLAGRVEHSSQ